MLKRKSQEAIRPNIFLTIPTFLNQNDEDNNVTDEDRILGSGADNAFWKILKSKIDYAIQEMDEANNTAIASGATLDQIGQNTIVLTMVKSVIRKITNIVDDAKETIDSIDGTGGNTGQT